MRARLSLLAVCATVSFVLIGQLGVAASSEGPAITGVKVREGLQQAADNPGDVLGKAAEFVRDLAGDKSGEQASKGPAIEPVKLRKGSQDAGDPRSAIDPVNLRKGSQEAADPEPAIEPVKLRKGLQDAAANPGELLGKATEYVRDLATDKTAAKADGFFDAMEARARKELKYWRSMGAAGVFQHYFGLMKDLTLDGFANAETKLYEFNKTGGLSGLLGTLQQYVEGWVAQAKDAIARMQGHATSTGDAAAQAAQGKAKDVMGSAQDATRGVRSAAQGFKDTAAETVKGVSDSAQETADAINQRGEL